MTNHANNEDAFWSEIIENHVLSSERVDAYRKASMGGEWMPLGKILIREGFLTVKQVMGIVSMQATEPHLRLGDLAVREGFCTTEDIEKCLAIQQRLSPGPIQTVLQDKDVSQDRLVNALVGYVHFLEGRLEAARAGASAAA